MIQFILGGIGFVLWALYIIMTYYSRNYSNIDHIEVASGFGGYLGTIGFIYVIYKIYQVFFSGKKQIRITFWHIISFSLFLFFILCISYSGLPQVSQSPLFGNTKVSGVTLFLHSLTLLLYPLLLLVLTRSLGSTLIGLFYKDWKLEHLRLQVIGDITIGFSVFVGGLLILGATGNYHLHGLLLLLALLSIASFPGHLTTIKNIQHANIVYENHVRNGSLLEMLNPKLISAEVAFLVVNFLIGVSLISALRPMPIGWDDLGVYMNFPKIMALSQHYMVGAGLYPWQLITGTGFFFSYTAAQAFYVNQLGGILAVIAITAALSLILESTKKKYLLSLPILFATTFYAMPMNIFQQAKDMKLDPALLAMSIGGLMTLFYGWKGKYSKADIKLIALAGVMIGFAFSIKVTTLMLIIGGCSLIAYRIVSLSGFFGFFFLFLAIFTQGGLWSQLNVWMPNDSHIITTGSIFFCVTAAISIFFAGKYHGLHAVKHWILGSFIFLMSVFIGFSPWIIKNISEVKPWSHISENTDKKSLILGSLIGGSGGVSAPDYTKIYTKEELTKREQKFLNAGNLEDGQSKNEDMGRYFGYETGINNYLKLPANLTFQKNQSGEFTDITYIFLALFPGILLFVRGRNGKYAAGVAIAMIFCFIYFFLPTWGGEQITSYLSLSGTGLPSLLGEKNSLLIGYIILLIINTLFITFSHLYIDAEYDENKKLKEMIILFCTYGFIFLVSAFGIVWYGIVIYFILFALIGLAASSFIGYTDAELTEKNDDIFGVKVTLSAIFFIFVIVYFIRSALPHGWNNFKEASYNEFKFNILSQEESIFAYRQDYVTPISTMNVLDPERIINVAKNAATNTKLKAFLNSEQLQNISARDFSQVLLVLSRNTDTALARDARNVGNIFYKNILYPNKENTNTGGIYRIGTFMTYLINQNRTRYFDDSLIFSFENFFYDQNHEVTIDRMKKLGLKYLLVDLNAATIDKDPRHALTTRFEHLLHTMKAKNLTLVDTDNLCLRVALNEYAKGRLPQDDDFIGIAGTNYESYRTTQSGETSMIYRGQKQQNCYNYILKRLYLDNAIAEYPYLEALKKSLDESRAITENGQVNQEKLSSILNQYMGQSWFALFEINDTPINTTPTNNQTIGTGSTNTGALE